MELELGLENGHERDAWAGRGYNGEVVAEEEPSLSLAVETGGIGDGCMVKAANANRSSFVERAVPV